ncbi:ABC-type cobalamin/Fe3+-siderophores transport system, ATPase components [Hahella chejuensis KCTC 2396]|uniref:ABC-type cobalamin/Fe3+-siderophores transport system, ATPase components n=1 Tax=Hahella chejuensis (strain KCTC 2396) TaxID=349521 RepID=Q2SM65_HAHCH|nr:ABC transporter ATP-binding protein [Hahella chejuensis]ABC28259.1 ABC-type cobalamin/Fe3+-siderophores transport system, ATPase components [Hahella chejuensis KCTC 2396]
MPMLEVEDIRVRREGREILSLPRLTLDPRRFTVILGHNGSGKSTLINLLARQIQADAGAITLQNRPLNDYSQRDLARNIAFLPQNLPEVAGLNVRELIRLGRFPWRGTFGRWRQEDGDIIDAAMAQTDVTRYADHLTDQLSGGERQRAWIAMLLAQQAPLLMLDEPTSALDLSHQYEVMALLRRLNLEHGRGVIVILHDVNLAARFADRIVALKQGRLAFDGAPQELLSPTLLAELYGIDIALVDHPRQSGKIAVVA